jgi:hypothetical protein
MLLRDNTMSQRDNMNREQEFLISTFNDGVNNIYRRVFIERYYDEYFKDYIFTFNGQIEHINNNPSFINMLNKVYGKDLLDYKVVR